MKIWAWLAIVAGSALLTVNAPQDAPLDGVASAVAQDAPARGDKETSKDENAVAVENNLGSPRAYVIRVPLPIRGTADSQVKRQVEQAVAASKSAVDRPIVVLEFLNEDGQGGEGSEFERAVSLARFLAGRSMSKVRTIAFVPQSLRGHAVLAALACEELIMAEEAEFGEAGLGEEEVDASMRATYEDIAKRRRIFPAAVVLSMLDPAAEVLKVGTLDGASYVDRPTLTKMQAEAAIGEVTTLVRAGDLGKFRGRELRVNGFVSRLADDRKTLATILRLPADGLKEALTAAGEWRAIRVDLHGRINARSISEVMQTIDQQIRNQESANLLCLHINSPGGSPAHSIELAGYLATFNPGELRTLAFVEKQALGDAAIPALICDELIVAKGAKLGGPGEAFLSAQDRFDLKDPLKSITKRKSRDWSLMLGLVDSETTVYRYNRAGSPQRLFCEEEWESQRGRDDWQRGAALDLADGLEAAEAIELRVAKHEVDGFQDVSRLYNVEQFETVKRSGVVSAIERFASQRWLARMLLFIGFFALITEFSAPGVGVPGFVSAICFMLFFWMQFLNGTAGWLEVVLFLGGLTFIAIEVLVLPGFGVFGGGGFLMVLISIILATQTFVLPRNSYQYEELPQSLLTLIVGIGGTFVSLLIMRHVFPHTPFARRMMLLPPDEEELAAREQRELLADLAHLDGQLGEATTQLTPSGKAMIGDHLVDVISRGELVAQGAAVRVVEVIGHRVVVEPLDEAA